MCTARQCLVAQLLDHVGAGGAHLDEQLAVAVLKCTVIAEVHTANRRVVRQAADDELGVANGLCRRCSDATELQCLSPVEGAIPQDHIEVRRCQTARHRTAHLACPEDRNLGCHLASGRGPAMGAASRVIASMRRSTSSVSSRPVATTASSTCPASRVPMIATSTSGFASVHATARRLTGTPSSLFASSSSSATTRRFRTKASPWKSGLCERQSPSGNRVLALMWPLSRPWASGP